MTDEPLYWRNLANLHAFEESLRTDNLALIKQSEALRDHFEIVGEAMNVMFGFTRDHVHGNDDELTIQFLGIRILNAASVSIKLALSGYYQAAFMHLRDIVEASFLMDYFLSNKDKIAIWKIDDKKVHDKYFKPFKIREALDKRDGFTKGARDKIYTLLSSHATHVTYKGFRLTTKENLGEIGPFISEAHLTAWLEEMAKHFGNTALIYPAHFDVNSAGLEAVRWEYDRKVDAWMNKYSRPSRK